MQLRAPEFWRRDGPLSRALAPFGQLYDVASRLRLAARTGEQAPVPVVCVGNLVLGGAGKTPVVLSLADKLRLNRGAAVHLITRGYGGHARGPVRVDPTRHDATAVGDEALLLAARAPTWVARRRCVGVGAAAAAGAEIVLLDDGHQDPSVRKDLSLVVIDGEYGLGNGRVFPAGPLRETPARGFGRADAVVLIGNDAHGLLSTAGRLPVLRARLMPQAGAERFGGRRVFAFAGIGRPEKLYRSLTEIGADVAGTRSFPDHHPYRPEEIMRICEDALGLAAVPVTTAKDAVRLPPEARAMVEVFRVELAWEDPEALTGLLDRVLPAP